MARGPGLARTRGAHLAELRKEAGLTQRGLAERAGLERTSITCAENGHAALSLGASVRVARVLADYGATVEALTVLTDEDVRPVRPVHREQQRPAGAA